MPSTDSYAVYKLPLNGAETPEQIKSSRGYGHLPVSMLLQNIQWFCRLRWIVIATFIIYAIAGHFEGVLANYGLKQPGDWPFIFAAVLAVANILYVIHIHSSEQLSQNSVILNLWIQITVDITVLTVVIHYIGSLETHISFIYLFHIVLACEFFPRIHSLFVTLLACALFITCVTIEQLGVHPPQTIFTSDVSGISFNRTPLDIAWGVFMATGIWVIVWYLASKLSVMVRQRDYELAQANKKLAQAIKDRMDHMKVTTHELKSPFAAISSNANLLINGYCGELPPKAVEVSEKITKRCKRVIKSIQDILVLSNLHSTSGQHDNFETIEVLELIDSCIEHINSIAQNRNIVIEKSCQNAQLYGNADYLKTMIVNLAANAVHYSNDNSKVNIECRTTADSGPLITVADHGIGIPADKLSHIFDEHYRTTEARQHNRDSNGLGLAIVKNIAIAHQVQITVKSCHDKGTVFELQFPMQKVDKPNKT